MAAPAEKTIRNLNGVYTLNKVESDPTDPILAFQGIGWLIRKIIGQVTVRLEIEQSTDEDGSENIVVTQAGVAGLKGTTESRHIPKGDDKEWRDHKDHIFGHVKGYTQWRKPEELSDSDEDEAYLKQDWEEGTDIYIDSYVESQGNGWTARQIWGFAHVVPKDGGESVRKYVRRVVVIKGSEVKRARLVYDYVSPLNS